jgi:hypothetical protein
MTLFSVNNNQLTSSIPDEFYNLTLLSVAYLNNNLLSGSLSSNIGKLTSLKYFLTAAIPTTIGLMSN